MVDYIRSAYTVDVRFFHDSPATTRKIQWSFVPETTPPMPWGHAFGSRTWDLEEEEEPLIGEVNGPRDWRGGTPPYALPIVGPLRIDNLGICGTEEQWKNGASIVDPIPPTWLNTPIPRCCKRPPLFARGGVAVGSGLPVLAPCCGDVPLPVAIWATFTNTIPLCPLLEGVPVRIDQSDEQPIDLFGAVSYFRSAQFISHGKDWRFWFACSEFSGSWALFAISSVGEYLGDLTFAPQPCIPFSFAGSVDWSSFHGCCGIDFADITVTD